MATPEPTAIPIPLPTASPTPNDDPDLLSLITARVPVASVVVVPAASSGNKANPNSVLGGIVPTLPIRPSVSSGVLSIVRLPLSTSGKAPAAVVTLTYPATWAGQSVWIRPRRGGSCSVTDPVTGAVTKGGNGFYLKLDAAASCVFTFQPPNRDGSYQVVTILGRVPTTLAFLVPGP